jgi:putative membrane protein
MRPTRQIILQNQLQPLIWLLVFSLVFVWSAVSPKDYFTWALEVFPAVIGLIILISTYQKFRFTSLVYVLILIHCIILMVGGHYTYAEVPLFEDLKSVLGFERNNYDKLGHFAQGFVPAMIAREVLIRKTVLAKPAWLNFIVVSVCLAISAFYELIEWWVALLSTEAAESFLGMQGYVWDTQSDMAAALIGAISALAVLSRWHNLQLHKTN